MERKQDRARRVLKAMDALPRNLARMFEYEAIEALDDWQSTDALIERMQIATDRLAK